MDDGRVKDYIILYSTLEVALGDQEKADLVLETAEMLERVKQVASNFHVMGVSHTKAQADLIAASGDMNNFKVFAYHMGAKDGLKNFQDEKGAALLSVAKMGSEGVDMPEIQAVILSTSRVSDVRAVQALGRTQRDGGGGILCVNQKTQLRDVVNALMYYDSRLADATDNWINEHFKPIVRGGDGLLAIGMNDAPRLHYIKWCRSNFNKRSLRRALRPNDDDPPSPPVIPHHGIDIVEEPPPPPGEVDTCFICGGHDDDLETCQRHIDDGGDDLVYHKNCLPILPGLSPFRECPCCAAIDAMPISLVEDNASSVNSGYLYCVVSEGFCKFGRTVNFVGRLATLQTGNPLKIFPLRLWPIQQGLAKLEQRVLEDLTVDEDFSRPSGGKEWLKYEVDSSALIKKVTKTIEAFCGDAAQQSSSRSTKE